MVGVGGRLRAIIRQTDEKELINMRCWIPQRDSAGFKVNLHGAPKRKSASLKDLLYRFNRTVSYTRSNSACHSETFSFTLADVSSYRDLWWSNMRRKWLSADVVNVEIVTSDLCCCSNKSRVSNMNADSHKADVSAYLWATHTHNTHMSLPAWPA